MKTWRVAALAGALLCGACSKEPAPAPAPAPTPVAEKASEPVAAEPEAAEPEAEPQEEARPEQEQAAAPEEHSDGPPDFKVGMTRDEVMKRFGDCAERRAYRAASPGSLYVEIYQPLRTEECLKRLGERRFTIRGGFLHELTPGLYPPPPKPKPRSRSSTAKF